MDKIEIVANNYYKDDCSDLAESTLEAYKRGFKRGVDKARAAFPGEYNRLKEKETPKRPTHEATLYKPYTCPTCKQVQREWYNHCPFCGQAIDWKDCFKRAYSI